MCKPTFQPAKILKSPVAPQHGKPNALEPPKVVKALVPQHQALVPFLATLTLFVWGVGQELTGSSVGSVERLAGAVISSYVYCDFWLWMLHCYLDRVENLKSKLWKTLAEEFQDHHDLPGTVLESNHVESIDALCAAVAITALGLGMWTSAFSKIFYAGVCWWGVVAGMNHYYCHAANHRFEIPFVFKAGQQWGMLPSPMHHKIHHTAPFDCNWNFLVGLHPLYEYMYAKSGESYAGLFFFFYSCNPVSTQLLAAASSLVF